MFVEKYT